MPPKNMTSVARNTHMPSLAASRCCARSVKCSCRECRSTASLMDKAAAPLPSDNAFLPENVNVLGQLIVVVGVPGHDGRLGEVVSGRRRGGSPLQPGGVPWVASYALAMTQGPGEINERQQVTDAKDGRAGARSEEASCRERV